MNPDNRVHYFQGREMDFAKKPVPDRQISDGVLHINNKVGT
jgi:hypothetical protein